MASKKEFVWPPQTMEDVLNLTPRKRKAQATSLSPSPNPVADRCPSALDRNDSDSQDEDEETLKLKLAQIEAKLKLKQLQKKKSANSGDPSQGAGGAFTFAGSRDYDAKRAVVNTSQLKPSRTSSSSMNPVVQVPLSPTVSRQAPSVMPRSPSRVTLGIDKGLKGRDISLRRPPNSADSQGLISRACGETSHPRSAKTFNQRIAEERFKGKAKWERQAALERTRSREFGSFQSTSTDQLPAPTRPATASFSSLVTRIEQRAHSLSLTSNDKPARCSISPPPSSVSDPGSQNEPEDQASFESFSGCHLSRRRIPHITLSRHLSPKTVFLLPQLFKTVVSPDFEAPDVDGDWVVMGIICSKSEPRDVGQNTRQTEEGKKKGSGKYMVMQMTDLKWEIELFLFGGGFEKFWKIPVGTVVAILNPGIMKPRKADTGKFSLTISESSDSLLEIGLSRDLGCCKAVKRDGKQCGSWVDKRHTHYCAFHVEQGVKKSRVVRAEVNSMSMLFSPPKKGNSQPQSSSNRRLGPRGRDDGFLREGPIMDLPQRVGGAGGKIFVTPGRSTAALLDDDDYLADNFHRGTKEDRLRKRLADAEKERQFTRNLIRAQGREGGLGVAYLKKHSNHDENERTLHSRDGSGEHLLSKGTSSILGQRNMTQVQIKADLTSIRSRIAEAASVKLSPIKRKRIEPPTSILKRQPVTKKTRFLTGNGIVVAGASQSGDISLDEDDNDLLI
ncbi:hypothetical protein RUND412_011368, partial [Rhizina undulata]